MVKSEKSFTFLKSCHPEERSDVRVASSLHVMVMRFLRHCVPQNDMKKGEGSNKNPQKSRHIADVAVGRFY